VQFGKVTSSWSGKLYPVLTPQSEKSSATSNLRALAQLGGIAFGEGLRDGKLSILDRSVHDRASQFEKSHCQFCQLTARDVAGSFCPKCLSLIPLACRRYAEANGCGVSYQQ
jgi:hypothetical protein